MFYHGVEDCLFLCPHFCHIGQLTRDKTGWRWGGGGARKMSYSPLGIVEGGTILLAPPVGALKWFKAHREWVGGISELSQIGGPKISWSKA